MGTRVISVTRFRDTESWMLFVGTEKEFKDFHLEESENG